MTLVSNFASLLQAYALHYDTTSKFLLHFCAPDDAMNLNCDGKLEPLVAVHWEMDQNPRYLQLLDTPPKPRLGVYTAALRKLVCRTDAGEVSIVCVCTGPGLNREA